MQSLAIAHAAEHVVEDCDHHDPCALCNIQNINDITTPNSADYKVNKDLPLAINVKLTQINEIYNVIYNARAPPKPTIT